MSIFNLKSDFKLAGDQPQAVSKLLDGLNQGISEQTLLGVTGSGKTFSMANVVKEYSKPTLVISHNKTLAAQLYLEFKQFFPENAVDYFVSYFDYYQPEAYIPSSDTYIEKDSKINDQIDQLRHRATDHLLTRKDVIIVASVSCIYGIGSVENYANLKINLKLKEIRNRDKLLRQLTDIQYSRNDLDFRRGTFRVRGDIVDIFLASDDLGYRVNFFGNQIEKISSFDPLTGKTVANLEELDIYPSSHFVTPKQKLTTAMQEIKSELNDRLNYFKKNNKLLEAQRLEQKTNFDLEMLQETGFVKGIENYSRYLTSREAGVQPATLLDYFPDDYLLFIDESHMSIPQIRGMYNGDFARKKVLVDYGFRLPSALDNRPLTFLEFQKHLNKTIYVSATPAEYELSRSAQIVEQIIRPTGLIDPEIEIRPTNNQIDQIISEIKARVSKNQRVLITTLTKRMAENLSEYLENMKIKVTYIHSDIETLSRTDLLDDLRKGVYDVLVGINLLREGLDLPEVSLVIILDADKEGFLRSEQALIQTIGRAARHIDGKVIMFADSRTKSIQKALDKTNYRRQIQEEYNKVHKIIPKSIKRNNNETILGGILLDRKKNDQFLNLSKLNLSKQEKILVIDQLNSQMEFAAKNLQFEEAAKLRDLIKSLNS
ncbi:MAG: excinuclease ABC subunit UvrB [Patescibacteria group bacterium]|nr:excinuclease ABC subunit UvrB [Patescibacteria group bacterium]